MKANEVLIRYAAGERDFQEINLRGQSFQGKDLSGADFSETDIRGANFTNAILIGTKFCKAEAGLQKRIVILLIVSSCLLSGVSGGACGLASVNTSILLEPILYDSSDSFIPVIVVSVILLVIFTIIRQCGFTKDLAIFTGTVAVILALLEALAFVLFGDKGLKVGQEIAWRLAGVGFWTFTGLVSGSLAVTGTWAIIQSIIPVLFGFWIVGSAIAIYLSVKLSSSSPEGFIYWLAYIVTWAVALGLLYIHVSWQALKENQKFVVIRTLAIAFAATGGTSFQKADLTDADFTGAILKSTDLRKATITRTCWQNTIKLDRVIPGNTILADTAVRELLVSGYGYNKNYINANLRGANLKGAHLNKANLKLADLSEATLEDANLEWANLTEAQAVGTDFPHAYFTGACLEAWNIESSTKLADVDCRFVYLLENPEPGTDNRERRPSSGEFQPGEFTKLFQEVLDTVDLIFRNGVDWKAFLAAFKKVQV
ncbi:MAG: pentapeptide repeat-containing protein [Moorea sp. SIO2I5]|nr:pentapeptide repeat-containing protein [Moorena sp. SIO2I5]